MAGLRQIFSYAFSPQEMMPLTDMAAIAAKEAFDYLDAPIERVATPDTPIPFAPELEQSVIPDEERIEQTIRNLVGE